MNAKKLNFKTEERILFKNSIDSSSSVHEILALLSVHLSIINWNIQPYIMYSQIYKDAYLFYCKIVLWYISRQKTGICCTGVK